MVLRMLTKLVQYFLRDSYVRQVACAAGANRITQTMNRVSGPNAKHFRSRPNGKWLGGLFNRTQLHHTLLLGRPNAWLSKL